MRAATDLIGVRERAQARGPFTFWSLGSASEEGSDGAARDQWISTVSVQERVRKLPEALILTAGYYASRVPTVTRLIHRAD